jgi:hypothetical protein
MGSIVSLSNTSIAIDTNETCTLDINNLKTLISNAGDAYFGDSANWSLVQIEFRSTTGKQREVVTINPTVGTGTFKVSAKARVEGWVIHEIRVKDFDGDFYAVKKADMIATDYDEPTISSGAIIEGTQMSLGNEFTQGAFPSNGLIWYNAYVTTASWAALNSYTQPFALSKLSNVTVEIDIKDFTAPGVGNPNPFITFVLGDSEWNAEVPAPAVEITGTGIFSYTFTPAQLSSLADLGTVAFDFNSNGLIIDNTQYSPSSFFVDSFKVIQNGFEWLFLDLSSYPSYFVTNGPSWPPITTL